MKLLRMVHGRIVGPGDVVEVAPGVAEVLIATGQADASGPQIAAAEGPAGDELRTAERPQPATRRKASRKGASS